MSSISSGDFLGRLARLSTERVRAAKQRDSEANIRRQCLDQEVFPLKFGKRRFNIIAEVKLRSPSAGRLTEDNPDYVARAEDYAKGGASAISVLTEPTQFAGDLTHLRACANAVSAFSTPVMRKDFLVDPYQVFEARANGASGVLLIVRMVSDARLQELLDAVAEAGLFALIEAFDRQDLQRCQILKDSREVWLKDQWLFGLNCRDLSSLDIVPRRFGEMVNGFPDDVFKVAESGLLNSNDVCAVAEQGYDMALIGSALMQLERPSLELQHMLQQANP